MPSLKITEPPNMPSPTSDVTRKEHKMLCSAICGFSFPIANLFRICRFFTSAVMNRLPTNSQRVVKPGVKKRRPPLACIQCYQRKLKCGRELPACSRCSKAGNANECTYRGDKERPPSVDGLFNDGPSGGANGAAASYRIENSSTETRGRHAISAIQEVDMTHLEGQGNFTKFYGYSYPLNLYQQVCSHFIQKVAFPLLEIVHRSSAIHH